MRGYLIDVENDEHRVVEISEENHLDQYYELIGCECIDVAVRNVNGIPYNIVVDDEGLLVDNPVFSAYDIEHRPMLAGNIILFGLEEGGYDFASLTDEDVKNIKSRIRYTIDLDRCAMHPVVIMSY